MPRSFFISLIFRAQSKFPGFGFEWNIREIGYATLSVSWKNIPKTSVGAPIAAKEKEKKATEPIAKAGSSGAPAIDAATAAAIDKVETGKENVVAAATKEIAAATAAITAAKEAGTKRFMDAMESMLMQVAESSSHDVKRTPFWQ